MDLLTQVMYIGIAPKTKAPAVGALMKTPKAAATTITNTIRILYSAAKNAIAPSLIAAVISSTFGIFI